MDRRWPYRGRNWFPASAERQWFFGDNRWLHYVGYPVDLERDSHDFIDKASEEALSYWIDRVRGTIVIQAWVRRWLQRHFMSI